MQSHQVKEAEIPIAARLAMAILGVSLLESDSTHAEEVRQTAEELNETLRELEAHKMSQTIGALKHAEAILQSVVKTAAEASVELMEKQAMGVGTAVLGGAMRAAGGLKKGLGGAASAAGRLLPAGPAKQQWLGLGTKAKMLGTAGVLGAGYAGFKGLQATRDYMESQPHPGFGKGPAIMKNVNEYGYPEY
jgi:hypothetical protein